MEIKISELQQVEIPESDHVVQICILSEDTVLYGSERKGFARYSIQKLDSRLEKHLVKQGDSAMVIISTGKNVPYKSVLDILELLQKNKIKRFSIIDDNED